MSRILFHLGIASALAVILTGAMGIFAWMAPDMGMHSVGALILLDAITWAVCTGVLGLTYARTLIGWIEFALLSFVCLYAIFSYETNYLIAYEYAHPPPRPMFHNLFCEDERVLLPSWRRPFPIEDAQKNAMWADHDDNMMALVIKGDLDGSYLSPRTGPKEATFHIHGFGVRGDVVVPRTTNALIVIRTDGEVRQFKLNPNVVRDFHKQRQSKSIKDLIADASVLLDAADRTALQTFLSNVDRRPDGK